MAEPTRTPTPNESEEERKGREAAEEYLRSLQQGTPTPTPAVTPTPGTLPAGPINTIPTPLPTAEAILEALAAEEGKMPSRREILSEQPWYHQLWQGPLMAMDYALSGDWDIAGYSPGPHVMHWLDSGREYVGRPAQNWLMDQIGEHTPDFLRPEMNMGDEPRAGFLQKHLWDDRTWYEKLALALSPTSIATFPGTMLEATWMGSFEENLTPEQREKLAALREEYAQASWWEGLDNARRREIGEEPRSKGAIQEDIFQTRTSGQGMGEVLSEAILDPWNIASLGSAGVGKALTKGTRFARLGMHTDEALKLADDTYSLPLLAPLKAGQWGANTRVGQKLFRRQPESELAFQYRDLRDAMEAAQAEGVDITRWMDVLNNADTATTQDVITTLNSITDPSELKTTTRHLHSGVLGKILVDGESLGASPETMNAVRQQLIDFNMLTRRGDKYYATHKLARHIELERVYDALGASLEERTIGHELLNVVGFAMRQQNPQAYPTLDSAFKDLRFHFEPSHVLPDGREARGTFQATKDGRYNITLTGRGNVTTPVHEMLGHLIQRTFNRMDDAEFRRISGIGPNDPIPVDAKEKWASAIEYAFLNGQIADPKVQDLLDRYRQLAAADYMRAAPTEFVEFESLIQNLNRRINLRGNQAAAARQEIINQGRPTPPPTASQQATQTGPAPTQPGQTTPTTAVDPNSPGVPVQNLGKGVVNPNETPMPNLLKGILNDPVSIENGIRALSDYDLRRVVQYTRKGFGAMTDPSRWQVQVRDLAAKELQARGLTAQAVDEAPLAQAVDGTSGSNSKYPKPASVVGAISDEDWLKFISDVEAYDGYIGYVYLSEHPSIPDTLVVDQLADILSVVDSVQSAVKANKVNIDDPMHVTTSPDLNFLEDVDYSHLKPAQLTEVPDELFTDIVADALDHIAEPTLDSIGEFIELWYHPVHWNINISDEQADILLKTVQNIWSDNQPGNLPTTVGGGITPVKHPKPPSEDFLDFIEDIPQSTWDDLIDTVISNEQPPSLTEGHPGYLGQFNSSVWDYLDETQTENLLDFLDGVWFYNQAEDLKVFLEDNIPLIDGAATKGKYPKPPVGEFYQDFVDNVPQNAWDDLIDTVLNQDQPPSDFWDDPGYLGDFKSSIWNKLSQTQKEDLFDFLEGLWHKHSVQPKKVSLGDNATNLTTTTKTMPPILSGVLAPDQYDELLLFWSKQSQPPTGYTLANSLHAISPYTYSELSSLQRWVLMDELTQVQKHGISPSSPSTWSVETLDILHEMPKPSIIDNLHISWSYWMDALRHDLGDSLVGMSVKQLANTLEAMGMFPSSTPAKVLNSVAEQILDFIQYGHDVPEGIRIKRQLAEVFKDSPEGPLAVQTAREFIEAVARALNPENPDEFLESIEFVPAGRQPRVEGELRESGYVFEYGTLRGVIKMFDGASPRRVIHEIGHHILHLLEPNQRAVANRIFAEGRTKWTRADHEKFAQSFEAYLMRGELPNRELMSVFEKTRAFLVDLWQRIKNMIPGLTDEQIKFWDDVLDPNTKTSVRYGVRVQEVPWVDEYLEVVNTVPQPTNLTTYIPENQWSLFLSRFIEQFEADYHKYVFPVDSASAKPIAKPKGAGWDSISEDVFDDLMYWIGQNVQNPYGYNSVEHFAHALSDPPEWEVSKTRILYNAGVDPQEIYDFITRNKNIFENTPIDHFKNPPDTVVFAPPVWFATWLEKQIPGLFNKWTETHPVEVQRTVERLWQSGWDAVRIVRESPAASGLKVFAENNTMPREAFLSGKPGIYRVWRSTSTPEQRFGTFGPTQYYSRTWIYAYEMSGIDHNSVGVRKVYSVDIYLENPLVIRGGVLRTSKQIPLDEFKALVRNSDLPDSVKEVLQTLTDAERRSIAENAYGFDWPDRLHRSIPVDINNQQLEEEIYEKIHELAKATPSERYPGNSVPEVMEAYKEYLVDLYDWSGDVRKILLKLTPDEWAAASTYLRHKKDTDFTDLISPLSELAKILDLSNYSVYETLKNTFGEFSRLHTGELMHVPPSLNDFLQGQGFDAIIVHSPSGAKYGIQEAGPIYDYLLPLRTDTGVFLRNSMGEPLDTPGELLLQSPTQAVEGPTPRTLNVTQPTDIELTAPRTGASIGEVVDQIAVETGLGLEGADKVMPYLNEVTKTNPDYFQNAELWANPELREQLIKAMGAGTPEEVAMHMQELFYKMNLYHDGLGIAHPMLAKLLRIIPSAKKIPNRSKVWGRETTGSTLREKRVEVMQRAAELEEVQQWQKKYERGEAALRQILRDINGAHPEIAPLDTATTTINDVMRARAFATKEQRKAIDTFLKTFNLDPAKLSKIDKGLTIQRHYQTNVLVAFQDGIAREMGIDINKMRAPEGLIARLPSAWRDQALLSPRYHMANALDMMVKSAIHGINPIKSRRSSDAKVARWGRDYPSSVFVDPLFAREEFATADMELSMFDWLPGYSHLVKKNREWARGIEDTFRKSAFIKGTEDHLARNMKTFYAEVYRGVRRNGLPPSVSKGIVDDLKLLGTDFSAADVEAIIRKHTASLPRSQNMSPELLISEMKGQWNRLLDEAFDEGIAMSRRIHFDFDDARMIEKYLGLKYLMGFHFWATRNVPYYLETFAEHPIMLRLWQDYRRESQENTEGLPARFNNMLPLGQDPFLALMLGPGTLFFNPLVAMSIHDQLQGGYVDDDTPFLGRALQHASNVGLAPGPWVTIPMTLTGQMGDDAETPTLLRHTGLIYDLTGGKVDIEKPFREGIGPWPGTEGIREMITGSRPMTITGRASKDYAINRAIADMSVEATGRPNDPKYVEAMANPDSEIYKEAKRRVDRLRRARSIYRFLSSIPMDYLGDIEGQVRTRRHELGELESEDWARLREAGDLATAYSNVTADSRLAQINAGFAANQGLLPGTNLERARIFEQYPFYAAYLAWLNERQPGQPRGPQDFLYGR